jgi:phenylalanyl-tRNA synthetase beta chain
VAQVGGDVRLFEIGSVFLPRAGQKLPDEPRRLALVLCGRRGQEFWGEPGQGPAPVLDFFDLKGVVEALLADLHVAASYRPVKLPLLHPARAAGVYVGERELGHFGELSPRVAAAYRQLAEHKKVDEALAQLGARPVLVGSFDLEALRSALPARHPYTPVPRFPAALRDIAGVVAESVPAARVAGEIRAAGGGLLRDVRLFDVYRGESVPAGHKSLAYALTYQPEDRTLTDKEVDTAHKRIEGRLRHVLGAQIRGEDR